jgi:hypothetical protein
MRDERLEAELQAWRRRMPEASAAAGECLEDERLLALALGELRDAEREAAVEHVLGCGRCAGEWRLLREVRCEVAAALPAPRPAIGSRGLSAIAAGLAAVGLGTLLLLDVGRVSPPHGPGPVLRGGTVEAEADPPDGALLGTVPAVLAWRAPEAAGGYRVSLMDAGLAPIWDSPRLSEPRAELPQELRQALQPGAEYLWSVEVYGSGVRRLGPFRFELARLER